MPTNERPANKEQDKTINPDRIDNEDDTTDPEAPIGIELPMERGDHNGQPV